MLDKKLTVIGGGNMGRSLLRGVLRSGLLAAGDVTVVEVNAARGQELAAEFSVQVVPDVKSAVPGADVILLAVKPFHLQSVLDAMKDSVQPTQLLVSIIAGAEASYIRDRVGKNNPVVRVMPNLPATVDAGASAIAGLSPATDEHLDLVESIFGSCGEVVRVEEFQLDAVTGLSGSGPAYIFMVIEALADGGVNMGLTRDVALKLATQTVLGAAKLVLESGEHPAVLKGQVTTPGGTTIAGVHALEQGGLRALMMNAVEEATERSRELSEAAKR
jgi:pyrroline-5-carboxylate reductase